MMSRSYVPTRLLETSIADSLVPDNALTDGADADRKWKYLDVAPDSDLGALIAGLYAGDRQGFEFDFVGGDPQGGIARMDLLKRTVRINDNHEFVKKHRDDSESCLEDIALSEVLLEVYLREEGVAPALVGEILQKRDALLRSLARDSMQSPRAIAKFVRDSAGSDVDLEIALVVAARAFGFVAKHISNANKPDGLARLPTHPDGDKVLVLEAKSSAVTPDEVEGRAKPSTDALAEKRQKDIDFATLADHVDKEGAAGCLLVAPGYAGQERDPNNNVIARIARKQRISCWTVNQLAAVLDRVEARHITAETVFDLVTKKFAPIDVTHALDGLLAQPTWDQSELIAAVIRALRQLETRLSKKARSVDMIATEVSREPRFAGVDAEQHVLEAVRTIAASSKGALILTADQRTVRTTTSLDELERRVWGNGNGGAPKRKPGALRKPTG